jgi:DNA-3-methyladenine glycosylase
METMRYSLLEQQFYTQEDVVQVARLLLGKYLFTRIGGMTTAGVIIETEAYKGIIDRASHSFGGRRTKRTSTMYEQGGVAYVYLCYGMHSLFNVVTNEKDVPDAVLIRGILPVTGLEHIETRMGRTIFPEKTITGPGLVSKALGISTSHNGLSLIYLQTGLDPSIWIAEGDFQINHRMISQAKRVGVEYAGTDAELPYRFILEPG